MRWLVAALAVVGLAGCAGPADGLSPGCDAADGADVSRAPYDNGVALHTTLSRDGDAHHVQAWACNEADAPRFLLQREAECRGSWTWTLTPPGEAVASASWPDGHYGDCSFATLPPGAQAYQHMSVEDASPGAQWRIRLQVYSQPQIVEDAGGGPVHAVYTL